MENRCNLSRKNDFKNSKEKKFVIISLLYIAYQVFPLFANLSRLPVWFVPIIITVALIMLYPKSHFTNCCRWFLGYFLVLLIYCLVKHPFHINGIGDSNATFRRLTIEIAWILPNILIFNILMIIDNPKVYIIITMGTLILITASFFFIIPSLLVNSRVLRLYNSGKEIEDINVSGLPSYTLMSCYSYFIPILCYGLISFKNKIKIIFFILLLIFAYVIYKTEITTSFIMMIFMLGFTITFHRNNFSKIMITTIIIFCILLISYETGLLLKIVDIMQTATLGSSAGNKWAGFYNLMTGNSTSGDLNVRKYCRQLSINCFFRNPLFGSPGVGGHSILLDRLGSMGLLGFIPYVMMLTTNITSWYSKMSDKKSRIFYIGSLIIFFVFLYIKGLFSGEGTLCMFVIVPTSILGLNYIKTIILQKSN